MVRVILHCGPIDGAGRFLVAANVSNAGNAPTLVADGLQQYVVVASSRSATPIRALLDNGGEPLPASSAYHGLFDENMVHPATAPKTETRQWID